VKLSFGNFDPQTPEWGLKDAVFIEKTKKLGLKPPFGGLGVKPKKR